MDEHARRLSRLHAAIEEGEASGYIEGDGLEAIDSILAKAGGDYRARGRSGGR